MEDNTVHADPMSLGFANTMTILTYVGLAAMLIPGIIYLFGGNSFLDVQTVAAHWGEPASEFWAGTSNLTINGYDWFLGNITTMDMLCIGGVAILGLVPFFSILMAVIKAEKGPYRILLGILLLEFGFAIIKPLVMAGGGE